LPITAYRRTGAAINNSVPSNRRCVVFAYSRLGPGNRIQVTGHTTLGWPCTLLAIVDQEETVHIDIQTGRHAPILFRQSLVDLSQTS